MHLTTCKGCGKEFWPNQAWQHEKCASNVQPASNTETNKASNKQRWNREAYNAYQRDYMRKRRLTCHKDS